MFLTKSQWDKKIKKINNTSPCDLKGETTIKKAKKKKQRKNEQKQTTIANVVDKAQI